MKTLIILIFMITVSIFSADIKIPVQGYLTDNNGVALNGTANIKFSLYNTDENGNSIWSNQDFLEINVENGEFSYMLGTTDFINSSILENSAPLYLEVEINNEVLSPRIELGTESKSVYSYRAEYANNSEKLGGKSLTELKSDVKSELNTEKLNAILTRLETLENKVEALETENTNLKSRVSTLESNLNALTTVVNTLKSKLDFITVTQSVNLNNLKSEVSTNTTNITMNTHDLNDSDGRLQYFVNLLSDRILSVETKTADMSVVNLTYGGRNYKTIRFSHVNVQIVNGSGETKNRYAPNGILDGQGLGNLIIGYNEKSSGGASDERTGYHNLIVGSLNNYTLYGSVVFGKANSVKSIYSSITGGYQNEVAKPYSSISGGADKSTPNTPSNEDWFYWIGDQYHSN